jgi:hypothetical protein
MPHVNKTAVFVVTIVETSDRAHIYHNFVLYAAVNKAQK